MLSILIPTYNYITFPLVAEIHTQCLSENLVFEIIVQDDFSTDTAIISQNLAINTLQNCRFQSNSNNLGRAKNLNTLLQLAKFETILILDCDTMPTSKSFIKNYLKLLEKNPNAILFGGIAYASDLPKESEMLRWKYGKEREALDSNTRAKNPYSCLLTSNIFGNKRIFQQVPFNETITKYGYEDLVFAKQLECQKIDLRHVNNEVFHLNYETSAIFLEKTRQSLETLVFLENKEILSKHTTKLQKTYQRLRKWKLDRIFLRCFIYFQKLMVQNLLSKNPKIFLFDIYKLGYFTDLQLNS